MLKLLDCAVPAFCSSWRTLFLAGLVAAMAGCSDGSGSEYVDYVPPEPDTDSEDNSVDEIVYDSEPDPTETFAYDLTGLPYKGVNVSSAEFGIASDGISSDVPGVHGQSYVWPDAVYQKGYQSPKKFVDMGMTLLRVPFAWERVQPVLGGDFNADELERMKVTVFHMLELGATVIIDMHNYGRYQKVTVVDDKYVRELLTFGTNLPPEDFADVWGKLAAIFKDHPRVFFGLMNEPHDLPTMAWVEAANAAIAAIRNAGAQNMILVGGNLWSGAHSWDKNWGGAGVSSAVGMLEIDDSQGNIVFEAHQYLNQDSSGWDGGCVSETIGSERMAFFTNWLRTNGKKGFLGEMGVLDDALCQAALRNQLDYMEANADVYIGWTYWAGSPRCPDWAQRVDPACYDEVPVQMQILQEYL